MTPVRGARVHFAAGTDLLGWDEFRAVAFAVSGALGLGLGMWLTHAIGLLR